jgi:hypothetical protein
MERPIREVDGVEREDADAVGATRSALDCRRAGNCGALDGRHKGAIDDGLDEEHVVEAHPGADNAIHARATDEATERAYDGSKVRRWRARFTLRPLQSLQAGVSLRPLSAGCAGRSLRPLRSPRALRARESA